MADRIRTAIVGTSWWVEGAHLPGLRARRDVEVVGLCGRNPDRLADLSARFGVAGTFTDYERMLDEARPEVVVVVTPNREHAPMTLRALDAGTHVICEKPLALNADEAAEMLHRAELLGRQHLTFFTYRGMPGPRHVKQLVQSGYLGRLHHAQACYLHGSWLDPDRPASWKTERAASGTGVIGDLGAHVIDLLQWWLGPVARAAGSLATFVAERPRPDGGRATVETDDAAAFVLEFDDGGQATAQVSRLAPGRHNYQRFELYGSSGTIVYEYEQAMAHVGRVAGARTGEGEPIDLPIPAELRKGFAGPGTFPAVYAALTDPFFASVSAAGSGLPGAAPSFADGVAAQAVIDAVARSAAGGRWEAVDRRGEPGNPVRA